ncbi:MAG: OsmC family protein [Candidatus Hermodarchaeota archaeon]
MSIELKTRVGLKQTEEMIFRCELGNLKIENLFIDEKNEKVEEKLGPSPAKLLGLSVLGCLAASFSFCLQKGGFSLPGLNGIAEVTIARNNKGFWRVNKIDIEMVPQIDTPEMRKRVNQCARFFEQYCIISESLRKGFEVNVHMKY